MKIILFDGVCNLCNSTVNFILKRDKDNIFRFAPLQSEKGRDILSPYGKHDNILDSLVFVDEERLFEGVEAVINITKYLKGYRFLYHLLRLLPREISNPLYSWVAKHRYSWFGKRDACRLPRPGEKEKFL